jgi:chorismate lyase / 3-hydroxybenzoate synthase
MTVHTAHSVFRITFGADHAELTRHEDGEPEVRLPLPWLAGQKTELLGVPDAILRDAAPFVLAERGDLLVGAAVVDASDNLEDAAEKTYRDLLSLCDGRHLHRVWNYVPRINEMQAGLERYQQFNIGRWVAFEERFGRDLRSYMPAASAVGIGGGRLVVLFSAGRRRPQFFENPSQVPAYHYPPDYGPRPPGFARGVVMDEPGSRTVFLSGTASIEGHRSIGADDWAVQFRTTMHNVETMLERMGVAHALDARAWQRGEILEGAFKCYLRHPESLSVIRESMHEMTGLTEEQITFVQADICRADLDLEIEATIKVRAGDS